jgi:hypothetical protein
MRIPFALATAFLAFASTGANAQCCNSAPFPLFAPFGGGCCNSAPVVQPVATGCCAAPVVQPQVTYVQPQPTVVTVQPAPIVVTVGQPVVQSYQVNQGPVYSGFGADYSPAVYEAPAAVPAYPYVGGYRWRSYYRYGVRPRPYVRAWRYPARYVGAPARRAYYYNHR